MTTRLKNDEKITNKRKAKCWYCKKEIPKGEGICVRVRVNWVGNADRFACKECVD